MKEGESIEVYKTAGKYYLHVTTAEYGHNVSFSNDEAILALKYLLSTEKQRESFFQKENERKYGKTGFTVY